MIPKKRRREAEYSRRNLPNINVAAKFEVIIDFVLRIETNMKKKREDLKIKSIFDNSQYHVLPVSFVMP